jgi:RNA polymerase sigma-70 factor (ECF subfamily)
VSDVEQSVTTDLLREARDGSDDALDRLFQRCAPKLLALIRLRLGRELRQRVESRDVLNETLLKAFERLDQLTAQDGAALMGWLARIAENEIHDLRDYHGRQRRDAACEVHDPGALDGLAARVRSQTSRLALREELERLEAALQDLEAPQREVVVLRKLEELSFPEIGQRMDRSADACRMLYARAMAALALALGAPR